MYIYILRNYAFSLFFFGPPVRVAKQHAFALCGTQRRRIYRIFPYPALCSLCAHPSRRKDEKSDILARPPSRSRVSLRSLLPPLACRVYVCIYVYIMYLHAPARPAFFALPDLSPT